MFNIGSKLTKLENLVRTMPGATQFTLMLSEATCSATALLSPNSAVLLTL